MRILIVAPGSRGDVQPYVALADGLRRAGHDLSVVTTVDHQGLLQAWGLRGHLLPFAVQQAIAERSAASALASGGALRSLRALQALATKASRALVELTHDAAADADVLLTGFGGALVAGAVARARRLPLVQAYNVPLTATADYAGALFPWLDAGPRSRRAGHALTRALVWTASRTAAAGALRDVLASPPVPRWPGAWPGLVPGPLVYGLSPAVLPRPSDWPADVVQTGFWQADDPDGFRPPPALAEFLSRGPPPICVGFGSMSHEAPDQSLRLVLDAVRAAGVRAILLSGWSGIRASALPAEVLALDQAPHSWLYPRCAGVVHHGGAGTTAAALRAGVPSWVVPFHGDQLFWAKRTHALGVGPSPVPRRRLTTAGLAQALRGLLDAPAYQAQARSLGARLQSEDGVGAFVAHFPAAVAAAAPPA